MIAIFVIVIMRTPATIYNEKRKGLNTEIT